MTDDAKPAFKYLAIRNWAVYQTVRDGQPCEWIKDWVNKDFDYDHMALTLFQFAILDKCRRLRGRLSRNL